MDKERQTNVAMTNRKFIQLKIHNKTPGSNGSLSYKSRVFYSYDDIIGRVEGTQLFISDNPATITTENHIKILREVALGLGFTIKTLKR